MGIILNIIIFSVGAKFLTLGIGAREIGMGHISSVLVRDANATYFNPALLSLIDKGNITAMHSNYLLDIKMESISLSNPFGRFFAGINLYGLFVSGLEGRTGPSENYTPFGASFLNTNISLSTFTMKNLSTGITFKHIYEKIDTFTASSFAFDIGVVYKPEKSFFEFGGVISNIGGKLKFKSENHDLPSSIKIGIGFFLKDLKLGIEMLKIFKENTEFRFGTEYTIRNILSIRGGYITGYSETHSLAGLTTGFGLKYKNLNIDYAFQPYGDLGNVHRISVGMVFSPVRFKLPTIKIRKPAEPTPKKEKIIKKQRVRKPLFDMDSLYNLALKKLKEKDLKSSYSPLMQIVYVDKNYKKAFEYFEKIKKDLVNKKIEPAIELYNKYLKEGNLLEAYAIIHKTYRSLGRLPELNQKLAEIGNIIINKTKVKGKDIRILVKGLKAYSEEMYKKASFMFKKLEKTEIIKEFISLCEKKRKQKIIGLKRDLKYYIKNNYFEKAYDVILNLENEGYFTRESMAEKARIQKKLKDKAEELFDIAKTHFRKKEFSKALIFIAKSIEVVPLPEAEEFEYNLLEKIKKEKEIYEKIMEQAIKLFHKGNTEDAYIIWQQIEKLNIPDERITYVKIYKNL